MEKRIAGNISDILLTATHLVSSKMGFAICEVFVQISSSKNLGDSPTDDVRYRRCAGTRARVLPKAETTFMYPMTLSHSHKRPPMWLSSVVVTISG